MKFYFSNSGCSLETEDFLRIVKLCNGEETKNFKEADVIIFHFCAISKEAIEYIPSLMAILDELKKRNPKVKVFVGGCAEEIIDFKKRWKIDGTFRKGHMIDDLAEHFGYAITTHLPMCNHGAVTIGRGCPRRCGFCKTGYLSMDLISKPLELVLEDVKDSISHGYTEVILLAENSTDYGLDLTPKVRLIDLLKAVCSLDGLEYLTISALCIDELAKDNELVEYIKNNPKIRKVQIEIQSLIPAVREKMNLTSSVEDVLRILDALRNKYIATNIMVGYPYETEEDFRNQLDLIKKKGFYFIQVNQYDNTPCVPACSFVQIPKDVSDDRLRALFLTINATRQQYAIKIIGSKVDCVFTSEHKLELIGHSAIVQVDKRFMKDVKIGQTIKVKLIEYNDSNLFDPYMPMVFIGERIT